MGENTWLGVLRKAWATELGLESAEFGKIVCSLLWVSWGLSGVIPGRPWSDQVWVGRVFGSEWEKLGFKG